MFFTDAHVQFQPKERIIAALSDPGCQVIALAGQDAPAAGLLALGAVKGLDLGTGRRVDLSVWLKP